ncbi:homeobox protein XHOX-3-like isoform X2 [Ornithodoros turicata]
MKDKRQRMALAWPYADPHFAAYMLNAAAAAAATGGYPYPLPASSLPFSYYSALSSMGGHRYHGYGVPSTTAGRPPSPTVLPPTSYLRSHSMEPAGTPLTCNSPPVQACTGPESCRCTFLGYNPTTETPVAHQSHPHSRTPPQMSPETAPGHTKTPATTETPKPNLFRPFKTDSEKV